MSYKYLRFTQGHKWWEDTPAGHSHTKRNSQKIFLGLMHQPRSGRQLLIGLITLVVVVMMTEAKCIIIFSTT